MSGRGDIHTFYSVYRLLKKHTPFSGLIRLKSHDSIIRKFSCMLSGFHGLLNTIYIFSISCLSFKHGDLWDTGVWEKYVKREGGRWQRQAKST